MTNQNKINKQLAREFDTFSLLARNAAHAQKHPAQINSFARKLPEILVSELLALLKLESAIENAVKADEAAAVFADAALAAKIEKVKGIPSGLSDLLKTLPEHEREKFYIAQKYDAAARAARENVSKAQKNAEVAQKRRNEHILAPAKLSDGTLIPQAISFFASKLDELWIPAGYALDFVENSQTEFRLISVKK